MKGNNMNNKQFRFTKHQEQTIIKAFNCIIKNAQNKKASPKAGKK